MPAIICSSGSANKFANLTVAWCLSTATKRKKTEAHHLFLACSFPFKLHSDIGTFTEERLNYLTLLFFRYVYVYYRLLSFHSKTTLHEETRVRRRKLYMIRQQTDEKTENNNDDNYNHDDDIRIMMTMMMMIMKMTMKWWWWMMMMMMMIMVMMMMMMIMMMMMMMMTTTTAVDVVRHTGKAQSWAGFVSSAFFFASSSAFFLASSSSSFRLLSSSSWAFFLSRSSRLRANRSFSYGKIMQEKL